MIQKVKDLRIKIDGLSQLVKDLNSKKDLNLKNHKMWRVFHTRETEMTYDSLVLSKSWLGKILEELNVETPYRNDGNRKTVNDIEETSDVSDFEKAIEKNIWENKSHIEKVDYLREQIKKVVEEIWITLKDKSTNINTFKNYYKFNIYSTECFTELNKARFWLGFELQRIRENDNNNSNI